MLMMMMMVMRGSVVMCVMIARVQIAQTGSADQSAMLTIPSLAATRASAVPSAMSMIPSLAAIGASAVAQSAMSMIPSRAAIRASAALLVRMLVLKIIQTVSIIEESVVSLAKLVD